MNHGLQDGAFRKGTTPEHRHRRFKKIMGSTSKPKEESSRNAAFTKVTTSTVAAAIGLVQAKQGLPYRTHSPSPRPLLVAEHRTPCRPDAHGRGSRPQPAPPMTHTAAPSNLCRSQPALPVPPCRPSHRRHNTICNRFGAPARPFSNACPCLPDLARACPPMHGRQNFPVAAYADRASPDHALCQ